MPSTSIERIDYDPVEHTLDVTFLASGRIYTYFGVEPETYEAFRFAPSKGRFFNAHIRDNYAFRRRSLRQRRPR